MDGQTDEWTLIMTPYMGHIVASPSVDIQLEKSSKPTTADPT